jgi:hypothetical protein
VLIEQSFDNVAGSWSAGLDVALHRRTGFKPTPNVGSNGVPGPLNGGNAQLSKPRIPRIPRKSASVRPESPVIAAASGGWSIMRRFVFGLALISLVACGSVSAGEGQAPNSEPDGSKKVQKLPSPGQPHPPKNNKQVSTAQSGGRSIPRSLPLSSAETYASEHSAGAPVSSAAKPTSPVTNSWTGFYVGAGIGAAQQ